MLAYDNYLDEWILFKAYLAIESQKVLVLMDMGGWVKLDSISLITALGKSWFVCSPSIDSNKS